MGEIKEKSHRNMPTTTIMPDQAICTMINTLTVKPENQLKLMDYLKEMTEKDVCTSPGFISANFHLSADKTRIINYAQWRSVADLQAMLAQHPQHVQRCQELAEHIDIKTDLTVVYCAYAQNTPTEQNK